MVRREEQPWESRALVLLDNRSAAHGAPSTDPASTFERAVSAAASVGVHLARAGYTVDLVTASGRSVVAEGSPVGDTQGVLLDALAVVEPSPVARLAGLTPVLRSLTGDGLIVAVLGRLDAAEAGELARMRRSGGAAVAVLDAPGCRSRRPPTTPRPRCSPARGGGCCASAPTTRWRPSGRWCRGCRRGRV